MEIKNASKEEVVQQVYAYAAKLMVEEKKSKWETIKILTAAGLDKAVATLVVGKIEEQITAAKKKGAGKNMLIGALVCVAGIVVTAISGGYVIAWGAILFGAVQFIVGVVGLSEG